MKKSLSITVLILILTASGCHHMVQRQAIRDEIVVRENEVVMMVTLRDGGMVRFDEKGASIIEENVGGVETLKIVGVADDGRRLTIPVAEIAEARLRARKANTVGTVLTAATIVTSAIVVGFFLLFSSWHH